MYRCIAKHLHKIWYDNICVLPRNHLLDVGRFFCAPCICCGM